MRGRPFPPGRSGNPGGRPKGLSAYVQRKCGKEGKDLIDLLYTIAWNDEEETRDRLRAIGELLDRGWNKPTQGMYLADEMRPLVVDFVTNGDLRASRQAAAETD